MDGSAADATSLRHSVSREESVCSCVCVRAWERKCEPQVSLFYVQPQQVLKKIELVAAGSKHRQANLAAGSIS